jgi:hypothetical protein
VLGAQVGAGSIQYVSMSYEQFSTGTRNRRPRPSDDDDSLRDSFYVEICVESQKDTHVIEANLIGLKMYYIYTRVFYIKFQLRRAHMSEFD